MLITHLCSQQDYKIFLKRTFRIKMCTLDVAFGAVCTLNHRAWWPLAYGYISPMHPGKGAPVSPTAAGRVAEVGVRSPGQPRALGTKGFSLVIGAAGLTTAVCSR